MGFQLVIICMGAVTGKSFEALEPSSFIAMGPHFKGHVCERTTLDVCSQTLPSEPPRRVSPSHSQSGALQRHRTTTPPSTARKAVLLLQCYKMGGFGGWGLLK